NSGEYVPHGSTVGLGPITTTAPDVVGERMARATSLLRDEEDFTVSIVGRDELRDDDLVTMQTPRAGTQIERGERITLDARVTAPEVQGGSIASAKRRIDRAAGSLSWRVRDEYFEEDLVYSQTPQPGELIYPRTEISLTPGVSLPNVSGMTPNQAARAIEGVGLAWRITSSGTRETINRNEVGGVYIDGQSPRAGFYPRRNLGEIRLSETQYVMAMRDVPNLVRTRMSDAVQGLASEGFVPVIVVDGQRMSLREWLSGVTERARTLYQEAEARARENETLDQLPSFNEFLENFNSRVGGQYPRGGERVEYGTTVELYPAMTK
ncbi:MAG TPA: PASTA domain-containing protein, partial [Pirellulales bacterium]